MLVLCHDARREVDMSSDRKLSFRWQGPYRILDVDSARSTYTLAELNGAQLRGTFAGNRLKRFYPRTPILQEETEFPRQEDFQAGVFEEVDEVPLNHAYVEIPAPERRRPRKLEVVEETYETDTH
jgi:hypothetical protein